MSEDSSNPQDPNEASSDPPQDAADPSAPQGADGPPASEGSKEADGPQRGPRVFGRFAFWIVVFPFIVYLFGMQTGSYLESMRKSYLSGELEHHHEEESTKPKEEVDIGPAEAEALQNDDRFLLGLLPLGESSYPYTYTFTIALTTAFMLLFGWGYFKAPFKISPLSIVVGVVGVVVWIGLAYVDREYIGLGKYFGGRSEFNPFAELDHWSTSRIWQFIAIRFFGLVVVVPIIEEFFVRGFLIRYVDDPDWDELPLGQAKPLGWASPTIYGVVAHMTEPLAALAWFSMVTWLYKKTGSIWDCVVAHAITNLLLGLYVMKFEQWHLW